MLIRYFICNLNKRVFIYTHKMRVCKFLSLYDFSSSQFWIYACVGLFFFVQKKKTRSELAIMPFFVSNISVRVTST